MRRSAVLNDMTYEKFILPPDKKQIKDTAKSTLTQKGVLLRLIFALLSVCIVYMAVELGEGVAYYSLILLYPPLAELMAFEYGITVLFDIVSILAVAPIFSGVYRLASLLSAGEDARVSEIFYYYSPKYYGRALVAFSVTAVPVMIFRFCAGEIFSLVELWVSAVDDEWLASVMLIIVSFIAGLLILGIAALLLLPYGRLFSVFAAVINGEGQPIGVCLRAALNATREKSGAIYGFRISFVPLILLSLLTVGMLLIIFTVPYMLISYFYYNAALFGKDPKPAVSTEVTFDER